MGPQSWTVRAPWRRRPGAEKLAGNRSPASSWSISPGIRHPSRAPKSAFCIPRLLEDTGLENVFH